MGKLTPVEQRVIDILQFKRRIIMERLQAIDDEIAEIEQNAADRP